MDRIALTDLPLADLVAWLENDGRLGSGTAASSGVVLSAQVSSLATSSTSFVNGGSPSITAPADGTYDIDAWAYNDFGAQEQAVFINGVQQADLTITSSTGGGANVNGSVSQRITGVLKGQVIELRYRSTDGSVRTARHTRLKVTLV